tara:strand:+ start:1403 stop:2125 length:723 start_codon:yes stop_codon:yes gene_type:complete
MKYFKSILISIFTIFYLHAEEPINIYNVINKKLNYQLEFKNIPAGHGYILLKRDSLDNKLVVKLKSEIKTNRLIDYLYKIRNKITIYMDENDLSLIKVINKINEGNYKKNHQALVDIKNMKLINNGDEKTINQKIYSPLSIIFSIREKLFNNEENFYYKTYSNGKQRDINISLIGKERIKTSFGEFNTIIFNPISNDKQSIFKNSGDMKIWYTDDDKKLPIKIEIKIKYGSIMLLLDSIE